MTKIIIANNADALQTALLKKSRTATVEAEYGQTVVEGSVVTLAHHAKEWQGHPCPCLAESNLELKLDAIGVSHFDLDTLGGFLAVLGRKPKADRFWACAAHVDIHGVHRLSECREINNITRHRLNAFWAWSEANRLFPPRGGSAEDCTEFFLEAERVLNLILSNDDALMTAGKKWAANKAALNESSFKNLTLTPMGSVAVRESPGDFVNHLYSTPAGIVANAVIAYNSKTRAITLSFEAGGDGTRDACKIMQDAFGPEAGGHRGIAGSPRSVSMKNTDTNLVLEAIGCQFLMEPNSGQVQTMDDWYDDYENMSSDPWGGNEFEDAMLFPVYWSSEEEDWIEY
jgi:hypothetical protein